MRRLCSFLTCILVVLMPLQPALAWSEGGHHLIAVLAYRQLPREQQLELLRILKAHPRYADDFNPPGVWHEEQTTEQWLVGRAGYWPDVARRQKEFNRPNWHYQLASTLVVGDPANVKVPATPAGLPDSAGLGAKDLHIAQALELCKTILSNEARPDADRAIALCWVSHLVADAHQPCHAGSLYAESLFPDGDRGANSIETKQGKNLHALWDGLLGPRYNTGDVMRRAAEIENDKNLQSAAGIALTKRGGTESETWLRESREYAVQFVYAPPVIEPVTLAVRARGTSLETIDLPESYLTTAGSVARTRAAEAAARLAGVLKQALAP